MSQSKPKGRTVIDVNALHDSADLAGTGAFSGDVARTVHSLRDGGQGEEDVWLTPKQAAAVLGLSRTTILRMAARGTLPCKRLSRKTIRFSKRALEAWGT